MRNPTERSAPDARHGSKKEKTRYSHQIQFGLKTVVTDGFDRNLQAGFISVPCVSCSQPTSPPPPEITGGSPPSSPCSKGFLFAAEC